MTPDTDLPRIPGFEYLRDIQQRLAEAHEFARQRQEQAGARQKREYDLRCQGRSFMPAERVWLYNPTRKKGVSPKLTSQWVGPGEVLEQLSDVVHWVKMCARGRVVVLHRDRLAPYRPLAAGLPDTPSSPSMVPLTPNRQWGVGACDPTGSQAAAASPSLSGLCCRLRTGDILVGGNVAPGFCLLC